MKDYLTIEEVKKELGSYILVANLVASGDLNVCYRVQDIIAYVETSSDVVHSLEEVNHLFIAETTEELSAVIIGKKDSISFRQAKHAIKLAPKKVKSLSEKYKKEYEHFPALDESFEWKFVGLIKRYEYHLNKIQAEELVYWIELNEFDSSAITFNSDSWGVINRTREQLFITMKSWNKYKRNPKTMNALDRRDQNHIEDLTQMVMVLQHIILEKSKCTQNELNQQIQDLLVTKETKLHTSKIANIFAEANKQKKHALKKNLIKIL